MKAHRGKLTNGRDQLSAEGSPFLATPSVMGSKPQKLVPKMRVIDVSRVLDAITKKQSEESVASVAENLGKPILPVAEVCI